MLQNPGSQVSCINLLAIRLSKYLLIPNIQIGQMNNTLQGQSVNTDYIIFLIPFFLLVLITPVLLYFLNDARKITKLYRIKGVPKHVVLSSCKGFCVSGLIPLEGGMVLYAGYEEGLYISISSPVLPSLLIPWNSISKVRTFRIAGMISRRQLHIGHPAIAIISMADESFQRIRPFLEGKICE